MPPLAFAVSVVLPLLQMLTFANGSIDTCVGSVMVTVAVAVQLCASVTVQVYVPAHRLLAVAVV